MKDRGYIKAEITPKSERTVSLGHPWVYAEVIISLSGEYKNGDLIDVVNKKGSFLGTGFINDNSKIRIRIISRNTNDLFDEAFYERRLRYAYNYRKTVMGETDSKCCRLIFGEADMFPGLTIDRFNDILVCQTLSLGIDNIKGMLFNLMVKVLEEDNQVINGVYERNDVSIRKLEGLEEYKGWFSIEGKTTPTSTITTIVENGLTYTVDFENGQKTGYFLDQKYNRLAVSKLTEGKTVLDCFTHTGSFALNSAKGGATSVLAADISNSAIEMAENNAKINGLADKIKFQVIDIFELLPKLESEKKKFDVVILDPPAFTKSRKTIDSAMRGYKEINYRAMRLVARGGFFMTCSCSHFATTELFIKMLKEASFDAGVNLRQVEQRQQAPDHPILWNVDETDYLKFFIFQIV